jgi:hypothetical protein
MAIVLQSSLFEDEFVPRCTLCEEWGDRPLTREEAKDWALSHVCAEKDS